MRVLLVEDEVRLAEAVKHILESNRYVVDVCHDGETGLDYALSAVYEIIILDVMLPKLDGFSVLKAIREDGQNVPVLMLSAKSETADKVQGLDFGADDYLTKPFDTEELLARMRAMTRRKGDVQDIEHLTFGDISLDTMDLTLYCGDRSIPITLKEKEILELFINRKGAVTSKDYMIEKLWGFDSLAEDNHVEVYISFIRKKLKYLKSKTQIKTLRGVGYKLEVEE